MFQKKEKKNKILFNFVKTPEDFHKYTEYLLTRDKVLTQLRFRVGWIPEE